MKTVSPACPYDREQHLNVEDEAVEQFLFCQAQGMVFQQRLDYLQHGRLVCDLSHTSGSARNVVECHGMGCVHTYIHFDACADFPSNILYLLSRVSEQALYRGNQR